MTEPTYTDKNLTEADTIDYITGINGMIDDADAHTVQYDAVGRTLIEARYDGDAKAHEVESACKMLGLTVSDHDETEQTYYLVTDTPGSDPGTLRAGFEFVNEHGYPCTLTQNDDTYVQRVEVTTDDPGTRNYAVDELRDKLTHGHAVPLTIGVECL